MVFDLDGVVADSEPLHVRAWVQVLGGLGVGVQQIGEPSLAAWVGVPDVEIVGGLVERFGLPLGAEELLGSKRAAGQSSSWIGAPSMGSEPTRLSCALNAQRTCC